MFLAEHFWRAGMPLKEWGWGDLLNSGLNPKTTLIAAYLAAKVDVREGTC